VNDPSGTLLTGLDHVQVAAPRGCEDAARDFYGGLLGLPEVPKPLALAGRGGCWFRVGLHELHVGVADPFAPATKAHPGLRVTSSAALRELAGRLADAGVEVEWADESEMPERLRLHLHDPFGNRLELLADDR
jgi:catechol 2,3-dioxygenase-like lactoylglutathione lyase family enzyme